jgi:hypothetical protein
MNQTSSRGILDFFHGNLLFLEVESSCMTNRSICNNNSRVKLLFGGVSGAELEKLEQSSLKQA